MDCSPPASSGPGGFSRQEYWSGLPCPPPTYRLNPGIKPGLPHCRWILYHLSHQESPRILEWIAYLFSRGSSRPRNQTGGVLHCREILYQLSYQGSPSITIYILNFPRSSQTITSLPVKYIYNQMYQSSPLDFLLCYSYHMYTYILLIHNALKIFCFRHL